jgi:hypothetical protein
MKVANTQTVIICYLTPEEIQHLGGVGTRVTLKYTTTAWTIQADRNGDKTVCHGGRTASLDYPGRVNARARNDIPQFGATSWQTRMVEGRTLIATVGSMAQPMRITGRLARKVKEAREAEHQARVRAGQAAALERHKLVEAEMTDMANGSAERTHEPEIRTEQLKVGLREAIELVNKHKDKLGPNLVLSITEDGYLSGMVEYGRKERQSGVRAGTS